MICTWVHGMAICTLYENFTSQRENPADSCADSTFSLIFSLFPIVLIAKLYRHVIRIDRSRVELEQNSTCNTFKIQRRGMEGIVGRERLWFLLDGTSADLVVTTAQKAILTFVMFPTRKIARRSPHPKCPLALANNADAQALTVF